MLLRALLASLVATTSALPQAAQSTTVQNDISNGVCAPVTLIFARGTSEQSNMGSIVGPPLASAMTAAFGAVAVQGVDYAASVAGATSGATAPAAAQGALMMANLTNAALAACPNTQVVLAGYSQGAEQVHGALDNLQAGQVAAAVTFGDPLMATAFSNIAAANTKINCNSGDPVCMEMFIITAAHLAYGTDGAVPNTVTFLQGVLG